MKELILTDAEVDQLYLLAAAFAKNGCLEKEDYAPGGPARILMEKIAEYLKDWAGGLNLLKQ